MTFNDWKRWIRVSKKSLKCFQKLYYLKSIYHNHQCKSASPIISKTWASQYREYQESRWIFYKNKYKKLITKYNRLRIMLSRESDKENFRGITISRYITTRTSINELLKPVPNRKSRRQIIFRLIDKRLYALLLNWNFQYSQ
jgi:hypothetical protein